MEDENTRTMLEDLCPIRYSLDVVGGKWKLPIICMLSDGAPKRYSAIRKKLNGITNVMLSQSLKELEAYGMLDRVQYSEIPPRVEYSLTDMGRSLIPTLNSLARWGRTQATRAEEGGRCHKCQDVGG